MWVHPNEILDGAVVGETIRVHSAEPSTRLWQNHPIILSLYRAHGKRFNFVGVVLQRTRWEEMTRKQLAAEQAAKLARFMGAQGVVISWQRGGNTFMDSMMTVQACERIGVKAVLVTYETGGESGTDAPVLYMLPEAKAIVSTGGTYRTPWRGEQPLRLPSVKRVVGGEWIEDRAVRGEKKLASEELVTDSTAGLYNGSDLWGERDLAGVEF